jgi:cellobiose PTS system EIIA component
MNIEKNLTLEEISFQIILHAGNARSSAMEAIQGAKAKQFDVAADKMKEAEKEINEAHHYQTKLLQKEASGEGENPTILLIHAQDHLMNSLTVKELAQEIIEIHQHNYEGENK